MENLVVIKNGKAVVSSKDIADKLGREHLTILTQIRNMEYSDQFRIANFSLSSYTNAKGKDYPCIDMTRDGFLFICMGLRGAKASKFKEQFISAFNDVEIELIKQIKPLSPMDRINQVSVRVNYDRGVASEAGRTLSEFKKLSEKNNSDLRKAIDNTQMKLDLYQVVPA